VSRNGRIGAKPPSRIVRALQHWPRILFLDEPKCEQGRKELRPGQWNSEMVGIPQIEARNTLLF
jgi:hypothetical protein